MAFKEGDSKPEKSGRKKGTPNKRTFDAIALAQEHDCDPLAVLLMIANGDWKGMGFKSEFKPATKYNKEKRPHITLEMRLKAAGEAVQYLYPKRKPVDKNGDDNDVLSDLLQVINGSRI
nr:hypothetical protein BHI3_07550 [Bacteriovorax sp. HI3]